MAKNKNTQIMEAVISEDKESCSIPEVTSENWSKYVMSKFTSDELDGENPRLDGLRRVAQLLVGRVVFEGCDLVSSPDNDNEMKACAKARVTFLLNDSREISYEALADASPNNCGQEFGSYPTAMADTRAKGRCYRAALGLKRVIAAEEAGLSEGGYVTRNNENIQIGQIAAIKLLVDQTGTSIRKLLDEKQIEYKKINNGDIPDLKSIKYSDAIIIIKSLNEMRNTNKT